LNQVVRLGVVPKNRARSLNARALCDTMGKKTKSANKKHDRRLEQFERAADPAFFNPQRDGPPPMPSAEELMKPSDKSLHIRKQNYAAFSYMAPANAKGTPPEEERHVPQRADRVWFKLHGVFPSENQAREFSQGILKKDPFFDVHVGPLYRWMDIPPLKEASYEYTQDSLKKQMNAVKEERDEETKQFDERISKAIDKSSHDMEVMRQVQQEENERLKAGGETMSKEALERAYLEKAGLNPDQLTLVGDTDGNGDLAELVRESLETNAPPVKNKDGYQFGTEVTGTTRGEMERLINEGASSTASSTSTASTNATLAGKTPDITPRTEDTSDKLGVALGETLTVPLDDGSDEIHITPQKNAQGEDVYRYDIPLRRGPPMSAEEFAQRYGMAPGDIDQLKKAANEQNK
jgi:hypothetical protein